MTLRNLTRRVLLNRRLSVPRQPGEGVPVLYYHGVEERPLSDPVVQENQMPLALFERQIHFLRERYAFISLAELDDLIRRGTPPDRRLVCLTFDDGYRNNARIVAPLLKQYGIPFTVFICTDNVVRQERFAVYRAAVAILYTRQTRLRLPHTDVTWPLTTRAERLQARAHVLEQLIKRLPRLAVRDLVGELDGLLTPDEWLERDAAFDSEAPLSLDEVRAIARQGGAIGAHGLDHTVLHDRQSRAEISAQVSQSRHWIADNIAPCRFFSFPDGTEQAVARFALRALEENGFDLGFIVLPEVASARFSRWLQPRIYAPADMELFTFLVGRRLLFDTRYRDFHGRMTGQHA